MTGPTSAASWMDCHDVASSGRSEAWSELLGLRSNPRTSPGSLRPDGSSIFQRAQTLHGTASAGLGLGLGLGAYGEDSALGRSPWGEVGSSVGGSGRKSLDSIFGAIPESHNEGMKQAAACGAPRAGLKDLDPLFSSVAATSSSGGGLFQDSQPQPHLQARATMPREAVHRPQGTLSPVSSHPLLQSDTYARRPPLSPVSSQTSLAEQQSYGRPATLAASSPVGPSAVLQHEVYRRAALDFVLELAGPEVPQAAGRECNSAANLLKADELPIPAFALDRDARVCMWNKQLAQLSGWEEEDMLRGQVTLASVLQPSSANVARNRSCTEVARSVLFGAPTPAEVKFRLRRKDSQPTPDRTLHSLGLSVSAPALPGTFTRGTPTRKHGGRVAGERGGSVVAGSGPTADCVAVSLRFSRRTDAVGTVCGVICVVVPLPSTTSHREGAPVSPPSAPESSLLAGSQAHAQKADVYTEETPEKCASSSTGATGNGNGTVPGNLFDHGPPSTSSSCSGASSSDASVPRDFSSPAVGAPPADLGSAAASTSASDRVPPGTPLQETPGTSTTLRGQVQGLQGAVQGAAQVLSEGGSVVGDVRALVMDSVDAVRMELAQNLERCGVDVVTCSSLGEAIWRYERSLSDPVEGPRFDVIFLELQPYTEELFLAIRDLRRLEEEARIMGQVTCLDAVLPPSSSTRSQLSSASTSSSLSFEGAGAEAGGAKLALAGSRENGQSGRIGKQGVEEAEEGEVQAGVECEEALKAVPSSVQCSSEAEAACQLHDSVGASLGGPAACAAGQATGTGVPDTQGADAEPEAGAATNGAAEAEKRCLILSMVNLNRWDLAGLDAAMEQCVRAGGDAVIPRSMPLQQLKTALRKLGIRSKYLMFPSRLPRALSGVLHNPLNLSR